MTKEADSPEILEDLESSILEFIIVYKEVRKKTYKEICRAINQEWGDKVTEFTPKMVEHRYLGHLRIRLVESEELTKIREENPNLIQIDTVESVPSDIPELVEQMGLDLDDWIIRNPIIKSWDGYEKGADGESVSAKRWSLGASLERRRPEAVQPVLHPVEFLLRNTIEGVKIKPNKDGWTLVIPDAQIGFFADSNLARREFLPFHDRTLLAAIYEFATLYKDEITEVVWLGDLLDLAEWSDRYLRPPEVERTTQMTLVECGFWLASFKDLLPGARHIYLEGNHEVRFRNMLLKYMPQAYGLKDPFDAESHPMFSIPGMLHLKELGIEYVEEYPDGIFWLNDVAYLHGKLAKQSGETTAKMLRDFTFSTIYGHTHRPELAFKTIWGANDIAREIFSMSPGSVAKNNGMVPGVKLRQNWQNAFAIVSNKQNQPRPQLLKFHGHTFDFGPYRFGEDAEKAIILESLQDVLNSYKPEGPIIL